MDRLAALRLEFAEKLRALSSLGSDRLVSAFASVPRERFLGPGPWQIVDPTELARGYQTTPDDDPRQLYRNVLVALDASRNLNNGEPAALARWLDSLELSPGERVLHVGCGVGYYTAIAAEVVGSGDVVGIELDPVLAERARENLRPWRNVTLVAGDASELAEGSFDAIFVNAGATEPLPHWLDALRVGGRLLIPLTVDIPRVGLGGGHMLRLVRLAGAWAARFVSPVGVFHCAGARSVEGERLLRAAYQRGGQDQVQSLRRDPHPRDAECWLHAERFCLSRQSAAPAHSTDAS